MIKQIRAYSDKEELKAMLAENERRLALIFGKHDQMTGEGMEDHTWKVRIKDFVLKDQWLPEEFKTNPFFEKIAELGSIGAYIDWYCETYGERLDYDEVADMLVVKRCERDASFAMLTCYKIQDKVSGRMIPFTLNYAQRILIAELERMRRAGVPIRLVLLKARQWGGSTLVQLYMAWLQLFVCDGWNSAIIAQTKDTSRRIKGMYRKVLDNFPEFIFGTHLQFSSYEQSQGSDFAITDKRHKALRDSVVTVASYENYENTRGAAISMAHCSECAYWKTTQEKSAEKLITSINGGILKRANTVLVLESTANGNSGYFYDQYQIGKHGGTLWKSLFIPFFYIENDMDHFTGRDVKEKNLKKKHFCEWLIRNKDKTVAEDVSHESGRYLWELWEKGATLEHIHWYIEKRSEFTSHEQMASEAPSDDVECFAFSGHKVWSLSFIEQQRKDNERKEVWSGDIRMWRKENGRPRDARASWVDKPTDEGWKLALTDLTSESGGWLKIWKHPDALKTQNQYIVTVDVGGRSQKADYSVITVLNRWNTRREGGQLEVVARWRGHLRYDLMAWKAVAIARYYKDALLVFESNTFDKKKAEANDYVEQGDHIRGILNAIGDEYDNLYTRPNTDAENVKEGHDTLIGFQTNRKTKQDIVDEFTVMFEDGGFIDHDKQFFIEAGIYEQRPDGSYGNIVGKDNHDDVLMTDMIGVYVHNRMEAPMMEEEGLFLVPIESGDINESCF